MNNPPPVGTQPEGQVVVAVLVSPGGTFTFGPLLFVTSSSCLGPGGEKQIISNWQHCSPDNYKTRVKSETEIDQLSWGGHNKRY